MPESEENGGSYGQAKEVDLLLSSYAQAHLVQQQIAELEKAEKERWIINRDDKIDLALVHLRERHKAEEENLMKNNKAINSESKKQRGKDEEKLTLKYSNL